ncbi:hypothetical protein QBC34DRAFT_258732, partial [Podospora aff. communis PSN243]
QCTIVVGGLTIVNSYWHPTNGDHRAEAMEFFTTQPLPPHTLWCGDLNTHHPSWCQKVTTATERGDKILEMASERQLHILNDTETRPTTHRDGTVDLAFGPPQAHMHLGKVFADHSSLVIESPA